MRSLRLLRMQLRDSNSSSIVFNMPFHSIPPPAFCARFALRQALDDVFIECYNALISARCSPHTTAGTLALAIIRLSQLLDLEQEVLDREGFNGPELSEATRRVDSNPWNLSRTQTESVGKVDSLLRSVSAAADAGRVSFGPCTDIIGGGLKRLAEPGGIVQNGGVTGAAAPKGERQGAGELMTIRDVDMAASEDEYLDPDFDVTQPEIPRRKSWITRVQEYLMRPILRSMRQ